MGKHAIDDDCNATGQMLVALVSLAPRFSRASLKIVKKFRFYICGDFGSDRHDRSWNSR
jgi:hypothetical protein